MTDPDPTPDPSGEPQTNDFAPSTGASGAPPGTASRDRRLAAFFRAIDEGADPEAELARLRREGPSAAEEVRKLWEMRERMRRELGSPGQLGEFRLLWQLGRGGMGEVWLAHQELLNRSVAVKVVGREHLDRLGTAAREEFLHEQQVLGQLHHTHIVTVFTGGEEGPFVYFAMPYIQGVALDRLLRHARSAASVGRPLRSLAAMARERLGVAAPQPTVLGGETVGATAPTPPNAAALVEPDDVVLTGPVRYSEEYVRSVVGAVADALQHAHSLGLLHRDVKPSNVMVDTAGTCWIIDFGLAWRVGQWAGGPAATPTPAGTPRYMAPEQYDCHVSPRSDVWGLGATLYELLTLRAAFPGETATQIEAKVRNEEPVPPGELVAGLPRDLAALCAKTLRKDPAHRYPSSADFAEDLRRWLRHEPVEARPAHALRRAWLWARRNPSRAVAVAAVALCVLLVGVGGVAAGTILARAASERARHAEESERRQRRELLIQEVLALRTGIRSRGWAVTAWQKAREAVNLPAEEGDLRLVAQATGTLAGLDAERILQVGFPELPPDEVTHDDDAAAIAFSTDGKRLLLGGADDRDGKPVRPARLLDERGKEFRLSAHRGAGPVAFHGGEIPLQVVPRYETASLLVWDVARGRKVSECAFAPGAKVSGLARRVNLSMPVVAISADGQAVAAAARVEKGTVVAVWDTQTGKRLFQRAVDAEVVAVSPAGQLVAAGDGEGRVRVFSTADGEEAAVLRRGAVAIRSLAFSNDGTRLGTGDAGGSSAVWDVESRGLVSVGHGSPYEVYALAFSPDDTLLASTGRKIVRLWNVATGRPGLAIESGDYLVGLAFSPDGGRLAVCAVKGFGAGGAQVWRLENGRGIRQFRGLVGQVQHVKFAADDRLIAAFSHAWQVGVWDAPTGRLRRVIPVPVSPYADNVDFALSPDGKQLAWAGHDHAALFDLGTGQRVARWELPPGLVNRLAFHPKGKLLLFRGETLGKTERPWGNDWNVHPRVWRLRALRPGGDMDEIRTMPERNKRVIAAACTPGGEVFVTHGRRDDEGLKGDLITAYDGLTGEMKWKVDPKVPLGDGDHALLGPRSIDPAGRVIALSVRAEGRFTVLLVDATSGRVRAPLRVWGTMGPAGDRLAQPRGEAMGQPEIVVWRNKDGRVLTVIGTDSIGLLGNLGLVWGAGGELLAWGNDDGTVSVCDLSAVNERLTTIGLGWSP